MKHLFAIPEVCGTAPSVEDLPSVPRKDGAAAAGPRNGAEGTYEAHKFNEDDSPSLVPRHPIIPLCWGVSE